MNQTNNNKSVIDEKYGMSLPLAGLKVIEFAGLAPVPLCGLILADYGASVIRIDKSNAAPMDCLGRGKRSIALDLKNQKGLGIAKNICLNSDILIEPFRPGVMEKLGLGPSVLCKENPRLIYARLTGYGQQGPLAKVAGHDINYLSLSGLLSLFGRKDSKPTPPVNLGADFAGGSLTCAMGIMMALFQRQSTGKGQVIDSSMVEGAAYVGSWIFKSHELPYVWSNSDRGTNLLDSGYPFYDTYKTKDGLYVAVGALEPQFAINLLNALGNPFELADLQTNPDKCRQTLTDIFGSKTRKEWEDELLHIDACVTPVLNLEEAAVHAHSTARQTFVKTDSQKVPYMPCPAPKLSSSGPCSMKATEANIGDHSVEILEELGVSQQQIEQFINDNVVQQSDKKAKL